MPAPYDPSLSRVRVSATLAGTYTLVGFVRTANMDRGSDNETTMRYLGGEAVRPGDRTLAGTIMTFFEEGSDATGQDLLLASWTNGTTVGIQIAPKGVGTGAKVYQFEAYVTSAPLDLDADGNAVENGFGYRGIPSTLTTVTLP